MVKAVLKKGYTDFELIYTPYFGTQYGWNLFGEDLPSWIGYNTKEGLETISKL